MKPHSKDKVQSGVSSLWGYSECLTKRLKIQLYLFCEKVIWGPDIFLLHEQNVVKNIYFGYIRLIYAYLAKNPQFSTDFTKIRFGLFILAYVVLIKRNLVYDDFFTS